jgi:hypothetical protein
MSGKSQPDESEKPGSILARHAGDTAGPHRPRAGNSACQSPCRRWSPEDDALLGKIRDEELSAQTGRTLGAIKQRRTHRGILLAVRQAPLWTPGEDRLLGTARDADIAARLGRTAKSVETRRQLLRRRPFGHKPFRPWTLAEDALLGKMPDRRLARKIRRAESAVRLRRLARGIRAFSPSRHFWTPEDERLLGTRPDEQVALLIGATVKAVRRRRIGLRIPDVPQNRREPVRHWTPEADAVVRSCSVREAILRLGRTRASVLCRRRCLGIRQIVRRSWKATDNALFSKFNDKEIARKLGRTLSSVENRRTRLKIPVPNPGWRFFTPAEDALLGTAADAEIAARLGRHRSSVQARRLRLGILRGKRPKSRRPWTPEDDALLGTDTDTRISARLGRHVSQVCVRRQQLGIPNFHWQQRCGRQRRLKGKRQTRRG